MVLPALIIAGGLAAVGALSGVINSARPPLPQGFADTDLTMNGSRMRGFALGSEGLIADWYYMRALQYIGDKLIQSPDMDIDLGDLRPLNPRLLYPMLQNATDLDPHYIEAYTYGAVVMPAIDSQQAVALAHKGISNNPGSWRLYQHLAYIYWKVGQYEDAAQTYERGSEIAGAPPFMRLMAASMRNEGGSRETARAIYSQMLDASNDDQVRITAQRYLYELDSLDDRDAIDAALARYREKNGRCVSDLREIMRDLTAVRLAHGRDFRVDKNDRLVDPTDAPYLLDTVNCKAVLDRDHTGVPYK
jgi:tetratricopeptide (TPR) repeat protein